MEELKVEFPLDKADYTNEAFESDATTEHDNKKDDRKGSLDSSSFVACTEEELGDANLRRDRPFSASAMSHRSVTSTRSHASLSSTMRTSEYGSKKMYSYKEGTFARAVEQCKQLLLNPETDKEFKGSWLLTEIDHWDFELEKLVLLTSANLYIVKFDFIKMAIKETRQSPLERIVQVQIADLKYPDVSIMPHRDQGGIRLHLGAASWLQLWNPFCKTVPQITLTHHALIYHENEKETVTYNADDFSESILIEVVTTTTR